MAFCGQQVGSFTLRFKVNFNFSQECQSVIELSHNRHYFYCIENVNQCSNHKNVCCKYYHSLALCFRSSVAPLLTCFKMLIVSMKEKCLQRQQVGQEFILCKFTSELLITDRISRESNKGTTLSFIIISKHAVHVNNTLYEQFYFFLASS